MSDEAWQDDATAGRLELRIGLIGPPGDRRQFYVLVPLMPGVLGEDREREFIRRTGAAVVSALREMDLL